MAAVPAAPLSREVIRAAQRDLARLGLKLGPIDGVAGKGTRQAVRDYQKARGLPQTGELTLDLTEQLRQERR